MIKLANNLWIGDHKVVEGTNLDPLKVDAVLNVAHDLRSEIGWPEIEYLQVGLIDGPGNLPAAYTAVVLALATLLDGEHETVVCCHGGSRSMAVVMIYLIIKAGKMSEHPTFLNYWMPWDKMLKRLSDRVKIPLPEIHPAHREAFDALPLSLIESLM